MESRERRSGLEAAEEMLKRLQSQTIERKAKRLADELVSDAASGFAGLSTGLFRFVRFDRDGADEKEHKHAPASSEIKVKDPDSDAGSSSCCFFL